MVRKLMDSDDSCDDSLDLCEEDSHEYSIVELAPYPFQVGGHNCILVYDEKTICKPLIDQEYQVYTHFPKELDTFVPHHRGVVKVYFEKSDEDIMAFALPDNCSSTDSNLALKDYFLTHRNKHKRRSCEANPSPVDYEASVSKNCIMRRWEDSKFQNLDKFILLEDITHSFKRPCVLDLKMGTRCFGDYSSPTKCERKKKRSEESTSATLGVRLCGMMVYNSEEGVYSFTDKYEGRRFNNQEFCSAVQRFFYNGSKYRTELFIPLNTKLKILLEQFEKIECYRFYCSSLLLLYDGNVDDYNVTPHIEVKMIDFAQTRVKEEPSNHHVGPDRGYILGIKTLIKITDELIQNFDLY